MSRRGLDRRMGRNRGGSVAGAAAAPVVVLTPDQIFLGDTGFTTKGQWLRADTVLTTGTLIDQVTDKSGSGHHEAGSLTRRPTLIASDAGFNNQPVIRFVGETEILADRDELTCAGWTRAAPNVETYWMCMVYRQFGPTLGTNRYLIADATVNAFGLIRPSTTNPDIAMRGASNANSNANAIDGQAAYLEAYWSGSLSTDYLLIRTVVANGASAGTVAGTAEQMSRNQAGTAWAWYDFAEKIVKVGLPTLAQLSQVGAYLADRYGSVPFT